MTKDLKSAERKGTPAKKPGPASKGQAKGQAKVQVKAQAKVQVKAQQKVPSKSAVQIKEKAVALAAAAMLTLPLVAAPSPVATQAASGPPISPTLPSQPNESTTAAGQEGTLIIRMERTFTVLGVGDGHTVFKDFAGATFYIDPATGGKQTVPAGYFLALDDNKSERGAGRIKFTNVMIVSILGTDAHGNTVMRNARNETFTLDPRTGNKALIKWPK